MKICFIFINHIYLTLMSGFHFISTGLLQGYCVCLSNILIHMKILFKVYRHQTTQKHNQAQTLFMEWIIFKLIDSLRWRHNDNGGVSNHQPHYCLLNRLFRHRSKKTSKLRVTGLCVGNSPGPVNSSHKGPVTRKFFPFDDVIMRQRKYGLSFQSPLDSAKTFACAVMTLGMIQYKDVILLI